MKATSAIAAASMVSPLHAMSNIEQQIGLILYSVRNEILFCGAG
ncbi:MAG: hypothetical protein JSV24_08800 [Bacteroidales bacterium]|nr:MAG: hypothetical protein JSV24_08800 [Bacteroidales bacterium]